MITEQNWEVDPSQTGTVQTIIARNDAGEVETRCIAKVFIGYKERIRPNTIVIDRRSHAHLIAAAPDLLAACKGLLESTLKIAEELDIDASESIYAWIIDAQDAIIKAENN